MQPTLVYNSNLPKFKYFKFGKQLVIKSGTSPFFGYHVSTSKYSKLKVPVNNIYLINITEKIKYCIKYQPTKREHLKSSKREIKSLVYVYII